MWSTEAKIWGKKPDPYDSLVLYLELSLTPQSSWIHQKERGKRKGPKRNILHFLIISYSFKRLILILKTSNLIHTANQWQVDEVCHIHWTLIFPKYATLAYPWASNHDFWSHTETQVDLFQRTASQGYQDNDYFVFRTSKPGSFNPSSED